MKFILKGTPKRGITPLASSGRITSLNDKVLYNTKEDCIVVIPVVIEVALEIKEREIVTIEAQAHRRVGRYNHCFHIQAIPLAHPFDTSVAKFLTVLGA